MTLEPLQYHKFIRLFESVLTADFDSEQDLLLQALKELSLFFHHYAVEVMITDQFSGENRHAGIFNQGYQSEDEKPVFAPVALTNEFIPVVSECERAMLLTNGFTLASGFNADEIEPGPRLLLPIRQAGILLGVILLYLSPDVKVNGATLEILAERTSIIGLALSNILAIAELDVRTIENRLAREFNDDLISATTRGQLMSKLHLHISQLVSYDDLAIIFDNPENRTCYFFTYDASERRRSAPGFDILTTSIFHYRDNLFARTLTAGSPKIFRLEDLVKDKDAPEMIHFLYNHGAREAIGVPLDDGKCRIGALFLFSDKDGAFQTRHLRLLAQLLRPLGTITVQIKNQETHLRRESYNAILLNVAREVAEVETKDDLLRIIDRRLPQLIGYWDMVISLINDDGLTHTPYLHHYSPAVPESEKKPYQVITYALKDSVVDVTIIAQMPIIWNFDELMNREVPPPVYIPGRYQAGIRRVLMVNLKVGTQDLGVLGIYSKSELDFLPEELEMFQSISYPFSVAIGKLMAQKKASYVSAEKDLVLSVSKTISGARDELNLIEVIQERMQDLLFTSATALSIIDHEQQTQNPVMAKPNPKLAVHPDYPHIMAGGIPIRDGIVDVALASDEPVVFYLHDHIHKKAYVPYLQVLEDVGVYQFVIVALRAGGIPIGILTSQSESREPIPPDALRLFKEISYEAAIALSNIIANRQLIKREREKDYLLSLNNAAAIVRDKGDLSKLLNANIKQLFLFDDIVISVLSQNKKVLEPFFNEISPKRRKDDRYSAAHQATYPVNDGVVDKILQAQEVRVVNIAELLEMETPPGYAEAIFKSGMREFAGISLQSGNNVIGGLFMLYEKHGVFPKKQFELFRGIANLIGLALANILANERIKKQLSEIERYRQQLEEENFYLQQEIKTVYNHSEIVGGSEEMQRAFKLVSQVSPTDSTVLILGETGTGKELIARAIHDSSPRKDKIMVKVNCATLPATLVESELFGHERGSFTGAFDRRIGKFELANKGTLFLDEIGELPLELQAKLLRALQEKEIERVGGKSTIQVDVRIIAATNKNLVEEVALGKFRVDLYYRLNIFPIKLPPLRNRSEDIPFLANHFVNRYSRKFGKEIRNISYRALQQMNTYHWPGNIRELEHLIERSILLVEGNVIKEIDLPTDNLGVMPDGQTNDFRIKTIEENEREHIQAILKKTKGKISGPGGAAELLGIPATTLESKIKRFSINKRDIR